jgi:hypothetical protein
MQIRIFSIRDAKSGVYHNPFFFSNPNLAARECHAMVNHGGPESIIAKYPQDFDLYDCGEFDTETGRIVPQLEGPVFLFNLNNMKEV